MRFADCEPVPFAVAILIVKSLAMFSIGLFLLWQSFLALNARGWHTPFEHVA